jgi:hypothetical protein
MPHFWPRVTTPTVVGSCGTPGSVHELGDDGRRQRDVSVLSFPLTLVPRLRNIYVLRLRPFMPCWCIRGPPHRPRHRPPPVVARIQLGLSFDLRPDLLHRSRNAYMGTSVACNTSCICHGYGATQSCRIMVNLTIKWSSLSHEWHIPSLELGMHLYWWRFLPRKGARRR